MSDGVLSMPVDAVTKATHTDSGKNDAQEPSSNGMHWRQARIDEEQIWSIIRAYFQEHQMNESKIRSYNKFVTEGLPNIIRNASPFVVKYQNMWHIFEFKRVTMNKPINTEGDGTSHALFPKEARLRGLSYTSDVFIHMVHKILLMPHTKTVPLDQVLQEGKVTYSQFFPYVKSIKFPTMLKSVLCHLTDAAQDYGECIFDSGGYFIINGGEKMLMYRERMAYNKIFCYTKKDASYTHYAEVRSEHTGQFRSTNTLYMMLSKATKTEAPSLYINGVPLVTWIRALGCTTDRAIYTRFRFIAGDRWNKNNNTIYDEYVYNCLENNQAITTRTDALVRIGKLGADKDVGMQRHNGLLYIKQKLLPHIGYDERDFTFKLHALLDIACKLFDFVQDSSLKTDKDSYFNKRLDAPEDLLGTLTRQLFASYLNSIKVNILKRLEKKKSISVHEIFSDNKVSKGVADSLASGMWHATRDKITQTGVSQKMERMNYISTQAQHTKILNPLRKEGKQTGPRLLVSTAYGVVCPADSPEGASCLAVTELVLLPDGSRKPIGKLKDGDEVVTLDRLTLKPSITKIHHHFVRMSPNTVQIATVTGRKIVCTPDHRFLTQLGMVEAQHLNVRAHHLCVFPVHQLNENDDLDTSGSGWFQNTASQYNGVFVAIQSVEAGKACLVSDFTTESNTHTFIGGDGFCVSNCGLVKHHAALEHCSLDTDPHTIIHLLWTQCNVIPFNEIDDTFMNNILANLKVLRYVIVRVNGRPIGIFPSGEGVAEFVRRKRRALSISPDTSVSYTDIDVDVRTDRGRNMRPLFVVDNLYKLARMIEPNPKTTSSKVSVAAENVESRYNDHYYMDENDTDRFSASRLSWNDLLAEGVIEYVDKEEEMNLVIAKDFSVLRKNEYTCSHMEVHGSVLYGVSASLIPFPDHNQAPRNTYQCAHVNSQIRMSDGTVRRIKDIKNGDQVVSVDPITLEQTVTVVHNHFIVPSNETHHPMLRISTISHRSIEVTDDHKLLTLRGWIEARNLDVATDKLAIAPHKEAESAAVAEYSRYKRHHRLASLSILSLEQWIERIEIKGECVFVPISSVSTRPPAMVSDFATKSSNHSFIANGFVSHNCQMGRQSQGIHSGNAKQHRMDISLLELWYAQRPLVETQLSKILNCQKFPTGQNMMVAVASIGQEGQEDAHLLGKSPIDLGLARSDVSRVVTVQEKRHGKMTALEAFAKLDPQKCLGRKKGDYSKIESDGLIGIGARVNGATVIAQKGLPIQDGGGPPAPGSIQAQTQAQSENWIKNSNASSDPASMGLGLGLGSSYSLALSSGHGGSGNNSNMDSSSKFTPQMRDTSVTLQNSEHGNVDAVMVTSGNDNLKTAKVRYTKVSIPQKGDKFSTRHGQKGTIGALIPREDLFWTEDGICPDIIINAIAFTSRMTFGQFVECLLGIVCCMTGRFGDATPFSSCYRAALYKTLEDRMKHFRARPGPRQVVDEISDALHYLGIPSCGDRVMRSGTTGKLLKTRIFMGMTYVQKLKHLVGDKVRARARGKLQALTRQPAEGRVNNGGLRWGQMENDAVQAHGAANNVRDRLCLSSDLCYDHICLLCHRSCIYHEETKKVYCNFCDKYDTAAVVGLPYAFHLFKQELGAIGVDMKLHVEEQ